MAKPTLQDTIKQLRESLAAEQAEAQKAFEEKLAGLLSNVKKTFLQSLEEAQNAFEGLDKDEQTIILNDAVIQGILGSFSAHKSVLQLLQDAHKKFETLDKAGKDSVKSNADVKAIISALGKRKTGGGGGGRGGKFNKFKDLILAELATGPKKQKFLEEKFGISRQSFLTWANDEKKFKNLVNVNEVGKENEWSLKP